MTDDSNLNASRSAPDAGQGVVFIVRERDVEERQLAGRTSRWLIGPASGSTLITHNVAYFATGHAPGHIHPLEDEVFVVTSGEGEVWINGVPYHLRPGTAVHSPVGAVHNIHNTSASALRLVGFMSPHAEPGSYPDIPPSSYDLASPPANRASFVTYEDEGAVFDQGMTQLMRIDRLEVAIRRLKAAERVDYPNSDNDLVIHVLEGNGLLGHGDRSSAVDPATAIFVTGAEHVRLVAQSPMRVVEARATGA